MRKILLVEDNEHLRKLYTELLEKKNYTVDTAPNALTALDKIETFEPDIILLDIVLPDTDGIELLGKIKEDPKFKKKPVLMLTGVSEIKKIKQCLDLGAAGYITKGTSIEDIGKKISMILNSFS